jgi:hypothetical protein
MPAAASMGRDAGELGAEDEEDGVASAVGCRERGGYVLRTTATTRDCPARLLDWPRAGEDAGGALRRNRPRTVVV